MNLRLETYWLPKDGNSSSEYEDAFSPDEASVTDRSCKFMSLAIADGATETSFSREWAKDLVAGYTKRPRRFYSSKGSEQFATLIRQLGVGLHARIEQSLRPSDVPWYTEQKARQGAYAALLGLTIWETAAGDPNSRKWRSVAFGDCCVFQIRDGVRFAAFPFTNSTQFSNRPFLLPSLPNVSFDLDAHLQHHTGEWQDGDELLLMTDALACWFLRRLELRSDPLDLLNHVQDECSFAKLIQNERRERLTDGTRLLHNDDVTLMRCRVNGGSHGVA